MVACRYQDEMTKKVGDMFTSTRDGSNKAYLLKDGNVTNKTYHKIPKSLESMRKEMLELGRIRRS